MGKQNYKFKNNDDNEDMDFRYARGNRKEREPCSQCGGTDNVRAVNFGHGMILPCCPDCHC